MIASVQILPYKVSVTTLGKRYLVTSIPGPHDSVTLQGYMQIK